MRRHLFHALTVVLAWCLVTGVLAGLAGPAEAKVPRLAGRYTAAIEPLANYVGQSTCRPGAKPGTTAFANLLLRTYRNSRSLGISRACKVGGKSEHKEGRAFDWGVSVKNKADRRSVKSLMKWLLKRDRYGNRYAMARRLGIQYMIWNRRIWGAYAAGSGWRKYTGANPHTDHVHFSLSWTGARKKTSYWNPRSFPNSSGSAPGPKRPDKPKPTPDRPAGNDSPSRPGDRHDWPDPRPDERSHGPRSIPEPRAPRKLSRGAPLVVEQMTVPSRSRVGKRTRKALVSGRRYLIEVSGTYHYKKGRGSVADAECSTRRGASWWQRERSLRSDQWYADHLDVYVDGNDLMAQADDGQSCDAGSHTYRWVYEAQRSGRVPFAVWDPSGYKDNRGKLKVRILDLRAVRESMSWRVPARSKAGATSPGLLQGGRDYLVTVSGTWKNGRRGAVDAECAQGSDGRWRRDSDAFDMVLGDWSYDSLSPRVAGVRSMPVNGGSECDAKHRYSFVHRVDRTSPLNVRVGDPYGHGDNAGTLKVSVKPYRSSPTQPAPNPTPKPTPEPIPLPAPTFKAEQLQVDSRSEDSERTQQEYPKGTKLRVTVQGTYSMGGGWRDWIAADAECTATSGDRRWRSSRLEGDFGGTTSPLGDLVVNGAIISWVPSDGEGSCDEENNTYTYDLTTTKAGPLRFVVADDHYDDNRGELEVEVTMR